MKTVKYGKIENKEVTIEELDSFSCEQKNDKRLNKRTGPESAFEKAKRGSTLLIESTK